MQPDAPVIPDRPPPLHSQDDSKGRLFMTNARNLPSFPLFEGRAVRIELDAQGEPLFCLADICAPEILDLSNPSMVAARLDDDEKYALSTTDPIGRAQTATFVTEPGLYNVIRGSRKDIAKRLRRWVDHEVLPAIRRTGHYGSVPALPTLSLESFEIAIVGWRAEKSRADAEATARAIADQRAAEETHRADHNKTVALNKIEQLKQLEKTLNVVTDYKIGLPTEKFYGLTISDAARHFGVQQDWLFAFMDSGKDEVGGGLLPIGWISGNGHRTITKAYAKDGSRSGGAYMRMATIRLPKGYTKQPYLTVWGLDRLGELLAPIPLDVKNNPATLQLAKDERRRLRTQKEVDRLAEDARQGKLPLDMDPGDDEPR